MPPRQRQRGAACSHGVPHRVCRLLVCVYLVFCTGIPVTRAVVTSFEHTFRYENKVQEAVAATTAPSPSGSNATTTTKPTAKPARAQQTTYASYGPLVRWNTFTILSSFGLERGARVQVNVTNLTVLAFPAKFSSTKVPVVFTLYDHDQWRAYSVLQLREMPLTSPTILCHYPSAMRYALTEKQFRRRSDISNGRSSSVAFDVTKASLYTLQVQVCGDASVLVAGEASMVNRGFDSELTEHLGVEELGLIPLNKVLMVIYATLAMVWIGECYMRRKTVTKISHAFQMALHVKTLEAFIKVCYYRETSRQGRRDTTFKAVHDIAESASGATVLIVMLLASLGWSITREELTQRERRLLGASFVFYFVMAFTKATCTSDDDICKAYLLTEYIIKSVMMLGVVVALNFTISQMRLTLAEARWNDRLTPISYMKLNQFQRFRFVFMVYLLVPTCLLVLNLLVITPPGSWRYDWVNYLLTECSTLFIYVTVGLVLRPLDPYIYALIARGSSNLDDEGHGPSPPSSPPAPPSRSAIVPEFALPRSDELATTNTAEQIMNSNRRLLQEFSHSSTSPPPSPSPPSSPVQPPSAVSPPSMGVISGL